MTVNYLGGGVAPGTGVVIQQTFEVLTDNQYNGQSNNPRITFTISINAVDAGGSLGLVAQNNGTPDPLIPPGTGTALYNPTLQTVTQLPGLFIAAAANQVLGANRFTLDGRWLHTFNGPGRRRSRRRRRGCPRRTTGTSATAARTRVSGRRRSDWGSTAPG